MTAWRKPEKTGQAYVHLNPSEYISVRAGYVLSLQYKDGPNPIPYSRSSSSNSCGKHTIMSFKNTSPTNYRVGQTNTFVLDHTSGCRHYAYYAILTIWTKPPEKGKLENILKLIPCLNIQTDCIVQ